jgi:hypothetical protein
MTSQYDLSTREGRQEFITQTWPGTAGIAYAGYRAYNRGAVVFSPEYERPMYVPLKGNDYDNPAIVKMVRDYDPEYEIVVIFFVYNSPTIFERYRVPTIPPPKAYQIFSRLHI